MKNIILVKTPSSEKTFEHCCNQHYKRVNMLLKLIEDEFNTDMNKHPELRHAILDVSNFIRRLPSMVSEVVQFEHANRLDEE